MKKLLFSALLLTTTLSHSADVVLLAKGNEQTIITQDAYPEMRFSEKQLINTTLSMLAMNLFMQQQSIAVPDEEMAAILSQQLFLDDPNSCKVAIELHFDPDNMPDGEGKGLWIATDEANYPLAEKVLTNFAKDKGVLYRDKPLPLGELKVEQFDCPTLYVNLDTNVKDGKNLWFIQPQSIMYYTQKLARAITNAVADN